MQNQPNPGPYPVVPYIGYAVVPYIGAGSQERNKGQPQPQPGPPPAEQPGTAEPGPSGRQPGPSGRQPGPSGQGPSGEPGPSRQLRSKRPRVPAVITLNPMVEDFSPPHGGVFGLHMTRKWMERFEVVRKMPQYRAVSVHTLAKAKNGKLQILSAQFGGNFVLEGTWPLIMEVLMSKIISATEDSFKEEDAAAQMAA